MIDREELERLYEAATPGPWEACLPGDYSDYDGQSRVMCGDDSRIAAFHWHEDYTTRNDACIDITVLLHNAVPDILNLLTERDTLSAENARLEEANRTIAAECIKWAREAGEAKGKLEGSEAAGVVDQWREKCEQLEAENAALTEKVERLEGALVKIQDEGDVRANSIATGALKEAP